MLFDELSILAKPTEYEAKFIELYQAYQNNELSISELNILKTMCIRYYRFKAQQLQLKDLKIYLSQIQKKDEGKKRKAENQRKFEVGGGVLSSYKVKNDEMLDTEKFIKRVNIDRYLVGKFRQSKIFKKVWAFDLPTSDKYELLFEVLNQLTLYGNKGETVKFLDFAIDAAQTKLKQKNDSVVE